MHETLSSSWKTRSTHFFLFASLCLFSACGGGGGGGSAPPVVSNPPPVSDDDARRMVLADIGSDIILPAIRSFDADAMALETSVASYAAAPTDTVIRDTARSAWNTAMDSWQRNEVLQVGPAGRSTNPDAVAGGQDFRDFIYSWPFTLDICALEQAAANGDALGAYGRGRQLLRFGEGDAAKDRGYELLLRAFDAGYVQALNELGAYHFNENGDGYEPERGLRYFQEAAGRGSAFGFNNCEIILCSINSMHTKTRINDQIIAWLFN